MSEPTEHLNEALTCLNLSDRERRDIHRVFAAALQAERERTRAEEREATNRARQVAGHVEEEGEVCRADCLACNDPVAALIRDLQEVKDLAFRRGRVIERLKRERN
jgi:hypothetical protein